MTAYALTAAGERWQLPPPLVWEIEYTSGIPCDSFLYRCPCAGVGGADPASWYRVELYEGQKLVFRGMVDECVQTVSDGGQLLELSGRGMAALLLDNEALPQDYEAATLADIIRDHVAPYGIQVAARPSLPPVSRFSVAAGSSEWSVIYQFAQYYSGITPRFDPTGRLLLEPQPAGDRLLMGDGTAIKKLTLRNRRYGVLSSVWVRDRYRDHIEKVDDPDFIAQGGCARRVITIPGRGDWQAMRYTGRYQLERAADRRMTLELEIPELFWAGAGQLVQINRSSFSHNGLYRVERATVRADQTGGRTVLELTAVKETGR